MRTATTGDLNPLPVTDELRTNGLREEDGTLGAPIQASAPPPPPPPPLPPTSIDNATTAETAPRAEKKTSPVRASQSTSPAAAREVSAADRETVEIQAVADTNKVEPTKEAVVAEVKETARPTTKVTLIVPTENPSAPLRESRLRNIRAAWITAGIIGLAIVFLLVAGVIVKRTLFKEQASVTPTPAVAQPTVQPTAAPPTPSPAANTAPVPPTGMVYIPGGAFQMGRDDGDEFERPAHAVTVAPFFLDRTEVTNEQYQEFIKQTGYRAPKHWKNGSYPEGAGRLPVVFVSWNDANEYAKWAGKRLPTEEEWEFAARGTDGRLYPWGSEWQPDLANTEKGERGRLVEVGSYSAGASPFGALDLCGNVWELTANDFVVRNRNGQEEIRGKVIRGGGFNTVRKNATATYRGHLPPDEPYDKTGFRCARDIR